MYEKIKVIFGAVLLLLVSSTNAQNNNAFSISISTHDIIVIVDETQLFNITLNGKLNEMSNLTFIKQHPELIEIVPPVVQLYPQEFENSTNIHSVCVLGVHPGNLDVTSELSPENIGSVSNIYLRVLVANSYPLITISVVVGWIYFAAWSVSFYPQIYINYRRKSVIGLNFDFLSLNIVGFALYGVFNMGLYWSIFIQDEYFLRNPRGLNPVLLNDVIFALHAMLATFITICQCLIYERGDQRVSITARIILSVFAVLVVIFSILAGVKTIHWLDFLYYCSYIKLTITLIKYVPQAVMNYRRKSTVGWSIGNILLDFTGGILSMLQMLLNAYNYDDWSSIFGDPTKFGLGLFSVLFDIVFIVQHYILYRSSANSYIQIEGSDDVTSMSNTGTMDPSKLPKQYQTLNEDSDTD